jgi:cytoskeletal protein CcmA (bactofilin family)
MGFFQDLKQDLSQTVNDLENKSGDIKLDDGDDAKENDLFNRVSELGDLDIDVAAMLDNLDSIDVMDSTDNTGDASNEAFMAGLEPEPTIEPEPLIELEPEPVIEELEPSQVIEPEPVIELEPEQVIEELEPSQVIEPEPVIELEPEQVIEPESEPEYVPDETMTQVVAQEPTIIVEENVREEGQETMIDGENKMDELLKEVELNIGEPESIDEPNVDVADDTRENAASTDSAVITQGMTITGDIISSGNMDLIGTVTGNIEILGKLNITGTVTGNSSAAEIYAESAQINGEVRSKGSVKIGQSSVIIGNIFATSAVIAGAVKGDIDVHGPVILDTSAIVMGNIKSKSVQINNGAVIEGMCSQCYADVSPSSFFNDVKKNRAKK